MQQAAIEYRSSKGPSMPESMLALAHVGARVDRHASQWHLAVVQSLPVPELSVHTRNINLGLHDGNTACPFCAYGGCNCPQVSCQAIADLHSNIHLGREHVANARAPESSATPSGCSGL